MAILTETELKKIFDAARIKQLASDYDADLGKPVYDFTIVAEVIAQAEGLVKASLSKQYSSPELEADKFIERLTADIAMYYLEARRNQFTPSVERGYERALRSIDKLREGEMKLAAASQLLPLGDTNVPTEVIEGGFFPLTEEEKGEL